MTAESALLEVGVMCAGIAAVGVLAGRRRRFRCTSSRASRSTSSSSALPASPQCQRRIRPDQNRDGHLDHRDPARREDGGPAPETELKPGDLLVAVGTREERAELAAMVAGDA